MTTEQDQQEQFDYEDRASKIMPTWSFWGEGVVLVKKEQWYKSRAKIIAILKQLHRAKKARVKK